MTVATLAGVPLWWRRAEPDVSDLAPEVLLHCETVPGSLTYRHYRRPGKYALYSRNSARWTVALTRHRLVVRRRRGPMVNVPWDDPRVHTLVVTVDGPDLLISADAHVFREGSSGTVETRARVRAPAAVAAMVDQMRGHPA